MWAWRSAVPLALKGVQAGLAHGGGHLAHLLAAAAAVLDHPLEEVGALLLPVDAGEGLVQAGQHRVFHAVEARRGEALDDHGLQALDHHAAAHLGGAGHAELVARHLGGEAEGVEERRQRRAARRGRPAAAARGCGRAGCWSSPRLRHSGPLPRRPARAARCLAPGEAELKSRKKAAWPQAGRAVGRHRHGLAGGDGADDHRCRQPAAAEVASTTMRRHGCAAARRAGLAVSARRATPWARSGQARRTWPTRPTRQLQVDLGRNRHGHARTWARSVLGQDASRPRRSRRCNDAWRPWPPRPGAVAPRNRPLGVAAHAQARSCALRLDWAVSATRARWVLSQVSPAPPWRA